MTREPKCAEWARSSAVDPSGTAGSYTGYVLVEWPLPWPRDVGEVGDLQPLVTALRGTGLRLQAVCAAEGRGDRTRVAVYRQPSHDGWSRRAIGVERLVHSSTLVDEAIDLVETSDGDVTGGIDVLICGHGRRDVCCGSKGIKLVDRVQGSGGLGRDVRLWRTSHLGGHRFAPTALVLPDATLWAFLDDQSLTAIVHRTGDLPASCAGYRGCSALPSPGAQAVERAVLLELGWSMLDASRRAVHVEPGRIRFEVRSANGEITTWDATVVEGRHMPIPQCGEPPEAATDYQAEVIVSSLTRSD
jgi:hypothetical protein